MQQVLELIGTFHPNKARELSGNKITLQGNFDPAKLLAPIPEIKKWVKEMIDGFGTQSYIANLGHGITPNVPVDHAKAFVEAVKSMAHCPPVGNLDVSKLFYIYVFLRTNSFCTGNITFVIFCCVAFRSSFCNSFQHNQTFK